MLLYISIKHFYKLCAIKALIDIISHIHFLDLNLFVDRNQYRHLLIMCVSAMFGMETAINFRPPFSIYKAVYVNSAMILINDRCKRLFVCLINYCLVQSDYLLSPQISDKQIVSLGSRRLTETADSLVEQN